MFFYEVNIHLVVTIPFLSTVTLTYAVVEKLFYKVVTVHPVVITWFMIAPLTYVV